MHFNFNVVLTYNNSICLQENNLVNFTEEGLIRRRKKIKIPHELQNKQINLCCNKIM